MQSALIDAATAPAVQVEGLSVLLGSHAALSAVSFTALPGQIVAILGPNGGGKTTLIRALLGLAPTQAGTIRIYGATLAELDPLLVGYVPQVKTLDRSFPALACELVASGLTRRWNFRLTADLRRSAHAALELVGAGHIAHKALAWLSGGELQRAYLARALVRKPRLVLLDEPASGVDLAGESDMHGVLERYCAEHGATVLLVTHDWGAALHHADMALVLARRVIAYGPPRQAITDETLRSAFGHSGHAHSMGPLLDGGGGS